VQLVSVSAFGAELPISLCLAGGSSCPVAVLAQYEERRAIASKRRAPSPQSSNLRVGSQLPFHIETAGPENDAGGAAGLELGETFTQLLASACEGLLRRPHDARHGFDAPRPLHFYAGHYVGQDPAALADSLTETRRFFDQRLIEQH
jgi:hypothetical protein